MTKTPAINGRKQIVSDEEAIASIPPVVVVEPVDVDVPAIRVPVDVRNKYVLCEKSSMPLPIEYSPG